MYFVRSLEAHCPVIACVEHHWELEEYAVYKTWIEVAPRMLTSLTDIAELGGIQTAIDEQLSLIFEKSEALTVREIEAEQKEIDNQARANMLAHEKQMIESWKLALEAREKVQIINERKEEKNDE